MEYENNNFIYFVLTIDTPCNLLSHFTVPDVGGSYLRHANRIKQNIKFLIFIDIKLRVSKNI